MISSAPLRSCRRRRVRSLSPLIRSRMRLRNSGEGSPNARRDEGPTPSGAAHHRSNPLLGMQGPPVLDVRGEPGRVEARRRETGVARTMLDEAVGYADMVQRQLHAVGREQLAYS